MRCRARCIARTSASEGGSSSPPVCRRASFRSLQCGVIPKPCRGAERERLGRSARRSGLHAARQLSGRPLAPLGARSSGDLERRRPDARIPRPARHQHAGKLVAAWGVRARARGRTNDWPAERSDPLAGPRSVSKPPSGDRAPSVPGGGMDEGRPRLTTRCARAH